MLASCQSCNPSPSPAIATGLMQFLYYTRCTYYIRAPKAVSYLCSLTVSELRGILKLLTLLLLATSARNLRAAAPALPGCCVVAPCMPCRGHDSSMVRDLGGTQRWGCAQLFYGGEAKEDIRCSVRATQWVPCYSCWACHSQGTALRAALLLDLLWSCLS